MENIFVSISQVTKYPSISKTGAEDFEIMHSKVSMALFVSEQSRRFRSRSIVGILK